MTGRPLASFDCIDGVAGATIDELVLADAPERHRVGDDRAEALPQLGRVGDEARGAQDRGADAADLLRHRLDHPAGDVVGQLGFGLGLRGLGRLGLSRLGLRRPGSCFECRRGRLRWLWFPFP